MAIERVMGPRNFFARASPDFCFHFRRWEGAVSFFFWHSTCNTIRLVIYLGGQPMQTTETSAQPFKVRFYDAKSSKKGRGVQVRIFSDRAEAEVFASQNRIYSGPCKVEVVS